MVWKDIPTLQGRYQVSDTGLVRSLPRNTTRGKLLKQATVLDYRVFGYNYSFKKNKLMKVHRAVASAFIPNPDNLPQVNHKNGLKADNRVENLEWCTASDNLKHAFKTDLKSLKGENHNQNILTEEMVLSIRSEYDGDAKALAVKYGVARTTISGIVTGRRWKHLL